MGTNRLTNTSNRVGFVRQAVAAGIRHIDTAHLYTGGESEAAIGAADVAEGCVVATKGGYHPGEGHPEVLSAQIEDSLRRLGTEAIELYYLHRVDPHTPLEQSLATIAEYRDRGRIRHIGISAVEIEEIERAREIVPIEAVQNHYNLDERRPRTRSTTARRRESSSCRSFRSEATAGRRSPRSPSDMGRPERRSSSPGC
jgi:aryl-alcohol dehydrogenase-like predicted oxidoreductase